MRKQDWNRRMTLLVLSDAQRSPRQFHVSRPIVILVPTLAILSISTMIITLQIRSSQTISRLETTLAAQSMQMEMTVTNKDEAIQRLQQEILLLSNQASSVKERMERIRELEEQLEQFIQKHDISSSKTSASSFTPLAWDTTGNKGGQWIAVHDKQLSTLGKETTEDFEEITAMLYSMESSIPRVLKKAESVQTSLEQRQRQARLKARQLELAQNGKPDGWPTAARRITSSFGYRTDPFNGRAAYHAGIDIAGNTGDPIYAAGAGKVIASAQDGSRGKYIMIEHPGGLQTWYMHLHVLSVSVGDQVSKGELIGKLGSTGRSTGPHLHFQVVKQNIPIDPLLYVR